MFKRLFLLTSTILILTGCTSLVREPRYVSQPSLHQRGSNPYVGLRVVNRGGAKYYAQGLVLPIIPVFFFSDPPEKMDFSKRLEIRIHSYSADLGKVSKMPESPEIVIGNKKYLPIKVTAVTHDVQIYTYELTPAEAPEFILLKTTTQLEDGSKLETPQTRFSFRDRVEWVYHLGR